MIEQPELPQEVKDFLEDEITSAEQLDRERAEGRQRDLEAAAVAAIEDEDRREIQADFVKEGSQVTIVADLGDAKITVEYDAATSGPDDLDTLYGALPQVLLACMQAAEGEAAGE